MDSIIIFVPDFLMQNSSGYLRGIYEERTISNCETFYIFDLERPFPKSRFRNKKRVIGSYCSFVGDFSLIPQKKNWVSINNLGDNLFVLNVVINGIFQDQSLFRIIIYERSSFIQSELLLLNDCNNYGKENDYLKKLPFYLKEYTPEKDVSHIFSLLLLLINFPLWLLSWVHLIFMKGTPVLRYTSIGLHMKTSVYNIIWLFETIKKEKKVNLKTGNYILSLIVDFISGYLVLTYLMNWAQPQEIFSLISMSAENFVNSLILLVDWLMGSPAGLKLNRPLNEILGGFFSFNINLWWAFLGTLRPVLEISYYIFLKLGLLGLSFQISVISDLITVVTFHTYCIYIYAARLFGLQVSGLCSLSRVFLGRNRNPEPGRIDSCPYTTEQLFLGTISFTVLLFLLPTTLVYYVVFLLMRLCINIVCGFMTWVRYVIQILPLYSTLMWFFCSSRTTLTVKITPKRYTINDQSLILFLKPVRGAWVNTMILCLPEQFERPPSVDFGEIFKKVISGKIISPW